MRTPLTALAMTALAAMAAPAAAPQRAIAQDRATVTHTRVIIRIPRMAPVPRTAPSQPLWEERRAPRCIEMKDIAGAAVTRRDSIDFVTRRGERMRAKLGRQCPALGFYSGFYMRATSDGKFCARRDEVHSRAGRSCPVDQLRRLVPAD